MIRAKVRITGDSPEETEAVRAWLLKKLPNLILATGQEGRNPKYEGRQKVMAYGDIDIPQRGEKAPVRTRRSTSAKKTAKSKVPDATPTADVQRLQLAEQMSLWDAIETRFGVKVRPDHFVWVSGKLGRVVDVEGIYLRIRVGKSLFKYHPKDEQLSWSPPLP